jgi:acyl phosphate:glycerol-3-phosphate acyltransferase
MFRLGCLVIGYLIGCIQSSYLIGKYVYKVDIREHGSGNAGATNTSRTLGKKAGASVFALDVSKAIAGFIIGAYIFGGEGSFNSGYGFLPGLYTGVGVMLGHNFPFYMNFKGGKGVASFLGMLFAFDLKIAILTYSIGMLFTIMFKYISLASMVMSVVFVILLVITGQSLEVVALAVFLSLMIIIRHLENIKRLIKGNERKVGGKYK